MKDKVAYPPNPDIKSKYVGSPDVEYFPFGGTSAAIDTQLADDWRPKKAAGILFICFDDNTIFLLKRSPDTSEPNTWCVVGGGLEEGETFLEGALREVTEECGSFPETDAIYGHTTYVEDNEVNFEYRTYICGMTKKQKDAWKPVLNGENTDWKWFDKDSLPLDELHFGIVYTLNAF